MRCVCQRNLKHMNVIYAHHPKLHWNRQKREETHEIQGKKDQQQKTLDFMERNVRVSVCEWHIISPLFHHHLSGPLIRFPYVACWSEKLNLEIKTITSHHSVPIQCPDNTIDTQKYNKSTNILFETQNIYEKKTEVSTRKIKQTLYKASENHWIRQVNETDKLP